MTRLPPPSCTTRSRAAAPPTRAAAATWSPTRRRKKTVGCAPSVLYGLWLRALVALQLPTDRSEQKTSHPSHPKPAHVCTHTLHAPSPHAVNNPFTCNPRRDTCTGYWFPGRDPITNYMDYSPIECWTGFTKGGTVTCVVVRVCLCVCGGGGVAEPRPPTSQHALTPARPPTRPFSCHRPGAAYGGPMACVPRAQSQKWALIKITTLLARLPPPPPARPPPTPMASAQPLPDRCSLHPPKTAPTPPTLWLIRVPNAHTRAHAHGLGGLAADACPPAHARPRFGFLLPLNRALCRQVLPAERRRHAARATAHAQITKVPASAAGRPCAHQPHVVPHT